MERGGNFGGGRPHHKLRFVCGMFPDLSRSRDGFILARLWRAMPVLMARLVATPRLPQSRTVYLPLAIPVVSPR